MIGSDRTLLIVRGVVVALVVLVTIRVAWINDDALITLRTALNITHGWGPGFNATESVQAFSHPLWFVLWVMVGALTNHWILGVIALSVLLVGLAVAILVSRVTSLGRLILVGGLLLLSNSFIDYTTSGLENPLAYACIALLIALSLTTDPTIEKRSLVWSAAVGLTAGAALLTRLDLLVLLVVPMGLLAWTQRYEPKRLVIGTLAFVFPLLGWFLWSTSTYSSLLANTFAAKTNVDIPRSELIIQGLRYLWVSLEHDPITLIGLILGIGAALAVGPRLPRAWALGVLAYLGYVVWIGGDFMSGRFLAVPLFVSVFLLGITPMNVAGEKGDHKSVASVTTVTTSIAAVALLILASSFAGSPSTALANPQGPRWEVDQNFNAGVSDELGIYVANGRSLKSLVDNLSLAYVNPDFAPLGDGTGLNRTLREIDKTARNWPSNDGSFDSPSEVGVFCGFLGTIGIATGPTTHLIDSCALTDRFLAERMSAPTEPFAWKPGHFHREIPEGYNEAIASGDPTRLTDMADRFELTRLWEQIR